MVTDRRWMLTDPTGAETVVCSLACVIIWACRHVAADVEACHTLSLAGGVGAA
jgi:hypothetical protein